LFFALIFGDETWGENGGKNIWRTILLRIIWREEDLEPKNHHDHGEKQDGSFHYRFGTDITCPMPASATQYSH